MTLCINDTVLYLIFNKGKNLVLRIFETKFLPNQRYFVQFISLSLNSSYRKLEFFFSDFFPLLIKMLLVRS